MLRFIETSEVLLAAARVLSPASVFLRVEGASSENITVDGGAVEKAGKLVAFAAGASEKSVKIRA